MRSDRYRPPSGADEVVMVVALLVLLSAAVLHPELPVRVISAITYYLTMRVWAQEYGHRGP